MAANTTPIFTKDPNMFPVVINAANTASDGSGTLFNIVTAGTFGTRVDKVVFRNAQVTAAASSNMLGKVFLSDANGANFRMVGEVAIVTTTRSNTVVGATNEIVFSPPLLMAYGQVLAVAQSVYAGAQDLQHAIAYASDY